MLWSSLQCLNLEHFFPVDVIVHRLLAASLGIYKLPTIFQDRPQLTSIADSMEHFSLLNFVDILYYYLVLL